MRWLKKHKLGAVLGTVVTAFAAAYGIQLNATPDVDVDVRVGRQNEGCQCIYREEVLLPLEEGVNKK